MSFRAVVSTAVAVLAMSAMTVSPSRAASAAGMSGTYAQAAAVAQGGDGSARPIVLGQADTPAFPGGKPITIIVPYPAGGVTDTAGRWMAAGLENELDTPVQVINVSGAAGQIALTQLMQSPADGYTIGYAILPNAITHYLDPKRQAAYTRENFETIANHHLAGIVLAVRSDSPYQTLDDLVEAARANPETITVADSGLLANPHLQLMVLEHTAGVKFAPAHFAGGAPSVAALLGGHADVLAASIADVLSYARAGEFRVLGVSSEEPDRFMPEVPTMRSLGYDIVLPAVTGLVAPEGTPDDRIEILSAAIKRVIESDEHRKRLLDFGLTPYYLDPEGFEQAWIAAEERIKPVLESVDIGK